MIPLVNNVGLTARLVPSLQRVAGKDNVVETPRVRGYDDFSFFAREVPGFYFSVGVGPPGVPRDRIAPNHSPRFMVDEAGLLYGLRAIMHATVDRMIDDRK